MNVSRGDIVMADFPFARGGGGKLRPVLVMQADYYNGRIKNTLVVMLTTNLRNVHDRAHFLIDAATPEGQQSGLTQNSLVSCTNIATLHESRLRQVIGRLSDAAMLQVETCLKAAFGMS
jgi:mRNA-degrading endonuclease toxin of MazEF toxin-antitoxin module